MVRLQCLVAGDEISACQPISQYLRENGLESAYVIGHRACLNYLQESTPYLLILIMNDWCQENLDYCQEIRNVASIPVIYAGRDEADPDLMKKLDTTQRRYFPLFAPPKELMDRVNGQLKLFGGYQGEPETFGNITVDYASRDAIVHDTYVNLTETEYRLLCYLTLRVNQTTPKYEMIKDIWPNVFTGDSTLTIHINHLRQKVEENPENPRYIKTLWRAGYIFELK